LTTIWRPDVPAGFVIDLDSNTFIEEPPGNTKTVAQVIAENRAKAKPEPTLTQLTANQYAKRRARTEFVNITDADDVLGESAYAEVSNATPGPEQTGITDTFTKINQFDTVGFSKNVTVSGANSNITILNPGSYSIRYSISFSGTGAQNYVAAVHHNDTEIRKSAIVRRISGGADIGSAASECILQLTANDTIDIRVRTVGAGPNNFTLQAGNFILEKVR
jgi:hypothetical protein